MPQRPWTRGRKGTTIRLHPPDWDKLKSLSVMLKISQNHVIAEAIRALFNSVTSNKHVSADKPENG
jgi:hypothetical protein